MDLWNPHLYSPKGSKNCLRVFFRSLKLLDIFSCLCCGSVFILFHCFSGKVVYDNEFETKKKGKKKLKPGIKLNRNTSVINFEGGSFFTCTGKPVLSESV